MSVFINWFFKKIYIVIYKVLNINRIQFILTLIVLQDIQLIIIYHPKSYIEIYTQVLYCKNIIYMIILQILK